MFLNFLCRFSRATPSSFFHSGPWSSVSIYLLPWNFYSNILRTQTIVLLETSYPTASMILTSWVAVVSSSMRICSLMMAKMLGFSLKRRPLPGRRERVPCNLYFLIVANTACFGTIYLLPGLWPRSRTITVTRSTVAQSIVHNMLITPFSASSFANTES